MSRRGQGRERCGGANTVGCRGRTQDGKSERKLPAGVEMFDGNSALLPKLRLPVPSASRKKDVAEENGAQRLDDDTRRRSDATRRIF